jgi:Uma2 family endonuclease
LELLLPLTRDRGFMTIEFPFRPEPEYEAWQADVAFVVKGRWENDDADYFSGAPDLVIEVLSASNRMKSWIVRMSVYRTAARLSGP